MIKFYQQNYQTNLSVIQLIFKSGHSKYDKNPIFFIESPQIHTIFWFIGTHIGNSHIVILSSLDTEVGPHSEMPSIFVIQLIRLRNCFCREESLLSEVCQSQGFTLNQVGRQVTPIFIYNRAHKQYFMHHLTESYQSMKGRKSVGMVGKQKRKIEEKSQIGSKTAKKFRKRTRNHSPQVDLLSDEQQYGDEYHVDTVIDKRWFQGKVEYRVKWLGYEETTWEPQAHLQYVKVPIRDFEKRANLERIKQLHRHLCISQPSVMLTFTGVPQAFNMEGNSYASTENPFSDEDNTIESEDLPKAQLAQRPPSCPSLQERKVYKPAGSIRFGSISQALAPSKIEKTAKIGSQFPGQSQFQKQTQSKGSKHEQVK